ncbi:DUF1934 domain-containing protein [Salisediminibacterium beveridgei]|uniref:DUF1934 domain-containing protein n=1 Tax=Salisediminibacterium beveridgei TaxID=632773 RepID=A0A1D7QR98_9BACI|nr:DUF1934 domain-containing protein [Salisediminibacterium beveridgei]AOM81526.1 hypothetical protein BBEV_0131 [Salisediminibacterium beveridgei]
MTKTEERVAIRMVTHISDGDRREKHTMDAVGQLMTGSGLLVLRFEEPSETDDIPTSQHIKCTGTEMTVRRHGQISMNQRFVEGVTTEGVYQTPEIRMPMETTTRHLTHEWDTHEQKGEIQLSYDLVLQGEATGRYDMTIKIEEATRL